MNNCFEWVEITHEEYQSNPNADEGNYKFETFEKRNNENGISEIDYKYFKKIPVQMTNEELNLYLQVELLGSNRQMDNKIGTIKSIMIFWLILTIINLVGVFILVSKFNSIL